MPEISFPSPSALDTICNWNGRVFVVDGKEVPILAYDSFTSGWTDELTTFHQEIAGDNHYIDVASRDHAIAALNKAIKLEDAVIIDIGCSSGSLFVHCASASQRLRLLGPITSAAPYWHLRDRCPEFRFCSLTW